MVGTILPIGYGERARGELPSAVLAYLFGSVVGAALLGASLAVLGNFTTGAVFDGKLAGAAAMSLGVIAILLGSSDASVINLPLPITRRQVPSSWYKRFKPSLVGLLYGFGLGIGVATHVPVVGFYAILTWVLLSGKPVVGGLVLSFFGLGRALPLLILGPRAASNGDDLERRIESLSQVEEPIRYFAGLVMVAAGSLIVASRLEL